MNSDNNREKSSKKLSEDLELLRLRQASNSQQQIQDKLKHSKFESSLEDDKNNSDSKDNEELSPKLKTPSGLGMGGKEPERFVGARLKKSFERGLPLPKPSYYLDAAEGQIDNPGQRGKTTTPLGYATAGKMGIDLRTAKVLSDAEYKERIEKLVPKQQSKSEMNQEELQNSANPTNQKSNDLNTQSKDEPAKDPSKMSLDERIAYKAAKSNTTEQSKTAEQSKTNNKNLSL